uniref:Major facilitator superfamily (MFS) profile domain-containing protein n=1 Tax=Phasianus colchicus TaxID=9054 RepID=A0A669R1A4_PHACC
MSGIGENLKAAGEFGPFQRRLVLFSLPPCLSLAFHQFCQLFMVVDVPHYCNTDWIRAVGPNLTEEEQLNLTLPRDADGEYEQCSMYSPVDWDLDSIMAYGLNATEKCSNGWVYPTAQQPSLLTEFDLVCDRKNLNDISQSVYMLGMFLGAMIFGLLSDRFGRRPVLLISILLEGLFGVAIALVPHFYVYLAFRCVIREISHIDGFESLFFTATEWVGVSYRPQAVLLSHCCFAAGQMILAGLSYGIPNWRLLQIVGSAPIFILFLFIWLSKMQCSVCESFNSPCCGSPALLVWFHVPWDMVKMLSEEVNIVFTHSCSLHLVLLCSVFRFVNSLVYYGLSLNVTNFGLDIYLTQLAFGAVEIPGRVGCIFMLQWFGRKKSQGGFLLLSGLVCLILTVIPEGEQPVVITVLATIGKFTASASFSSAYVYTAELFPTIIRQSGVSLCSMVARVAGIIAPLILLLEQYHQAIPMAIYGGTTVLGGLLCFLLPETRGVELADGTEGDQELGFPITVDE